MMALWLHADICSMVLFSVLTACKHLTLHIESYFYKLIFYTSHPIPLCIKGWSAEISVAQSPTKGFWSKFGIIFKVGHRVFLVIV